MLKHDETEQATLAFLCPFEITLNFKQEFLSELCRALSDYVI